MYGLPFCCSANRQTTSRTCAAVSRADAAACAGIGLASPIDAMSKTNAASAACTTLRSWVDRGAVAQRVMRTFTQYFLTQLRPDVTQAPDDLAS